MFFVNVTIACITLHENVMMKAHHSHSYPLLSALLFFFFCYTVLFRLIALYLVAPKSGLKAGTPDHLRRAFRISAVCPVCYGFIQDKLGLRKTCCGISPCY